MTPQNRRRGPRSHDCHVIIKLASSRPSTYSRASGQILRIQRMSCWAVQSLRGVLTELEGLADGRELSTDTLLLLVLFLEVPPGRLCVEKSTVELGT